jgi:hypothetical protein
VSHLVFVRGRSALVNLLAVLLAESLVMLGALSGWLGGWSATANQLSQGLLFAAPATAAAGAWIAGRQRTTGYASLAATSVRARNLVWQRMLGEVTLVCSAAFAIVAAASIVASAIMSHSFRPTGWFVVACSGFLACFAAAGGLVGRLLPSPLAVAAAGAGSYLVIGALVFAAWAPLATLTPFDTRVMILYKIPWWDVLLQAAFLFALAGVGFYWFTSPRKPALYCAWTASFLAAVLLFVGTSNRTFDPTAARLKCKMSSGIEVCMPLAKAFNEPTVTRALSEMRAALPGLMPARLAYVDDEAGGVDRTTDAQLKRAVQRAGQSGYFTLLASRTYNNTASTLVSRAELIVTVAHRFIGPGQGTIPRRGAASPATPSDFLVRDLMERLHIATDGSAFPGAPALDKRHLDYAAGATAIAAYASWSPRERESWFEQHEEQVMSGRLQWADFLQSR